MKNRSILRSNYINMLIYSYITNLFLFSRKNCLSPVWKSRLQGLLAGLGIAAILIGIILAVLLTTNSKLLTRIYINNVMQYIIYRIVS